MTSRTIFVTGARGKTGREVLVRLRGEPEINIRAGSSQPARPREGVEVQPVVFDWSDPGSWEDASGDADAIYLMRPDRPDAPELVAQLVSRNRASHVVLVSEQGAETLPDNHWVRRVEAAVTERAKTWTLLRPSWFQQNLIDPRFNRDAIRHDRVLSLPTGGGEIAWVDVRDIADVAVAALVDETGDHHGRAHTITGPESLTVSAIAHMLSEQVGEPVSGREPPLSGELRGLDPWTTGIMEDLYERVRVGDFGDVVQTVEAFTGHKPRAIDDFVREQRDQWLPTRS